MFLGTIDQSMMPAVLSVVQIKLNNIYQSWLDPNTVSPVPPPSADIVYAALFPIIIPDQGVGGTVSIPIDESDLDSTEQAQVHLLTITSYTQAIVNFANKYPGSVVPGMIPPLSTNPTVQPGGQLPTNPMNPSGPIVTPGNPLPYLPPGPSVSVPSGAHPEADNTLAFFAVGLALVGVIFFARN